MDQKPTFSVLLSFQNQRDEVEPSLTALYELESVSFELIIIDDASSDGTEEAIHSLLDYYQHEHTFFFNHIKPAGRGNCLNEALQEANTDIIWAPQSIQKIDKKLLQEAIQNLKNGGAPCLIQTTKLPESLSEWPDFIYRQQPPRDGLMLWNLNHIASYHQFFDPYLNRYQATEWLIRTGMDMMEMRRSFFTPVERKEEPEPSPAERQELLMALLRRPQTSSKERKKLLSLLSELPPVEEPDIATQSDHELLERAAKLKMKGQLSAALECVEKVLEHDPGNPEAKHLKIKLLERKRRFVEASELKFELEAGNKSKNVHSDLEADAIKTSIIIPTAVHGRPALENCLISIHEYCDPNQNELIIIDNASLDDTHEYLQQLKENKFFNCRIITNNQNNGFAASVNQGLDAARGQYACIMHNDVEFESPAITRFEQLMDEHPDYALMGPLVDNTLNQDQLISNEDLYQDTLEKTDYLDSFFLMFRLDTGLRMDEKFGPAFFDDIDFSFEARREGYKVGIAPEIQVTHHYGRTTFALDLDTESRRYWKNITYFNDKWDIQPYSAEELQSMSRFDQLLTLDEWVNPLYPEPAIKEKFEELYTEELETEILKTDHDTETTLHLIHLLMVMEKREVMRELEKRIDGMELPTTFIYEIIRFYFNRNVYSRCQHYLNRLTDNQRSLTSELYQLAIFVDEKKMDEAIPLLTALLDEAPSNPQLYKLASDIHSFEGNSEEAASFYRLAYQINPFEFPEKEFRLNT